MAGGSVTEQRNSINDDYLQAYRKEFLEKYNTNFEIDISVNDLDFRQIIGKGAYSTVVLAKDVNNGNYYAVKVIKKSFIVRTNKEQTLIEKRMLTAIRFPFIVHMEHYFTDNSYIYFVMPYYAGGEMFTLLRKRGKFEEKTTRFYAAQVVLAFEYLHSLDVIYRDLKPENIVLDLLGYIKITDLGFAKIVTKRTYTLCGTPDYLAPEIILSQGYSQSVDWWALGVLIYEMRSGVPPFFSKHLTNTYEMIISGTYRCPLYFSDSLKDIVDKLIQVDSSCRFGSLKDGADDIKRHAWFRNMMWMDVLNRSVKAPYIPHTAAMDDTSNFNSYDELNLIKESEDIYKNQLADF